MFTIEIPSGVEAHIDGSEITVKGKMGSTTKYFSSKFLHVKSEGQKITVESTKEKKLMKKGKLAAQAFAKEMKNAVEGTDKGIIKKMTIVTAHFPISLEVKGKTLFIKNIFGERVPREVPIQGDTKIEAKGTDVTIKGVDIYDVTQTIANIRKGCSSWGHDTRVFQDGLYLLKDE